MKAIKTYPTRVEADLVQSPKRLAVQNHYGSVRVQRRNVQPINFEHIASSTKEKELLMKASNAFVLIAVLGFSGAALAADSVKSGGPDYKPGRAVDEETVKSGDPTYKPGRQIDGDGTAKTGGPDYKPGRQIDEDGKPKVKTGGPDYKAGQKRGAADDARSGSITH
jgi:hypothetical protein